MKKRSEKSYEVSGMMVRMGYPSDVADMVGCEMNTDFTARQMIGYLRDGKPKCLEDVVDEMQEILERRERIVRRQIAKKRDHAVNDLYLRSFSIDWEESVEPYVRRIEALRNLEEFSFSKRVTLFTGENGSGKSTLLEGLTVACGLNPEGGTQNYRFHTYDDHSLLSDAVRLTHGTCRPKWSYFLRAESFYAEEKLYEQGAIAPRICFGRKVLGCFMWLESPTGIAVTATIFLLSITLFLLLNKYEIEWLNVLSVFAAFFSGILCSASIGPYIQEYGFRAHVFISIYGLFASLAAVGGYLYIAIANWLDLLRRR